LARYENNNTGFLLEGDWVIRKQVDFFTVHSFILLNF